MIERGGGRTSGLTDWHLMDVNSMWACLQDHDTTNHWKQVAGWRKVCDLAQTHLARLQEYRRGLAEAWPPATNAAARTYLAELDALIEKVRLTHDAAATNYTTLAAATQAISGTRAAIEKIHEEYAAKLQQKRAYEATAADPKAAMGSRVPDRPVTDADLEQLNVQARGIMYGLSGELQQAQVALQKPPQPTRPPMQADNPDAYGSSSAPIVPPIVPVPTRAAVLSKSKHPASNTVRLSGVHASSASGPVLGGAGTGLTVSPSDLSHPSTAPSSSNLPLPPGESPTSPSRPTAPNVYPPAFDKGGRPAPVDRGNPPQRTPPVQPRPATPGGIIGGFPGSTSQPVGGTSQPRRINPVGGVIGGGSAGTSPTGGAGSRPGSGRSLATPPFGMVTNGAQPGITSRGGRDEGEIWKEQDVRGSRKWNPDDPWEIDQGVNPVVKPPDEGGPIDPGPAIGLKG